MSEWLKYVISLIRSWFVSHHTLAIENLALRSQLARFEHQVTSGKRKKPRATPAFRQLWVILSRCTTGWESTLVVFKPDTIVHRVFRLYWKRKSKRKGRPALSRDIIKTIEHIHAQNPL